MATRRKHDVEVDPFNAGEPTLPWDEPDAYIGNEGDDCAFGDAPYKSPVKTRDNYDAPISKSTGARVKTEDRQTSKAARKAAKAAAKQARAHASKTADKPVHVIRTVLIIFILVNVVGAVFDLVFDQIIPAFFFDEPAMEEDYSTDPVVYDEDEQVCVDIVSARLDQLTSAEGPERSAVADAFDKNLSDSLGYSAEELGLDANGYAGWLLTNCSYKVSSVYTFDDGTASLYCDIWCPASYEVENDLMDELVEYFSDEGISTDPSHQAALSEGQKAEIREIFGDVLAKTDLDHNSYAHFALNNIDSVWTIDEEEYASQIEISLGIF